MTTLHMPVIAPPLPPVTTSVHYANVAAATSVTASLPTPNGHDAIDIQISNPSYGKLYAMAGGTLRFVPPGQPLYDGTTERATEGALCLELAPADALQVRAEQALPSMVYVLYIGVAPASIRPALAALLPEIKRLPQGMLQDPWKPNPAPTDLDALANGYLDAVVRGSHTLVVPAGAYIGDAQPATTAPGAPVKVRLRMVGPVPSKGDVSPLPFLRNMSALGYGGASNWSGHPLIAAVTNFETPINMYLQFKVWDLNTKTFQPLPNVSIRLMDFDTLSNDELGIQTTDGEGRVHFHFASLADLTDRDELDRPDIFFLVEPGANQQHYGLTLPAEWSTKGWMSVGGKVSGYHENYDGSALGREDDPVVFSVGLDLHLQLGYLDPDGNTKKAPKGVPVSLSILLNKVWKTDEHGQVHDVIFDVQPEKDIYFGVQFEMEDLNISLPKAVVVVNPWYTNLPPPHTDRIIYEKHDLTSIGTQQAPAPLICKEGQRNVALYFLTLLREWSVFLYHMTGGDWTGVSGLEMYTTSISGRSYSWPVRHVNIAPDDHWNRKTIIHELSHQIVWKEVDRGSLGIAYQSILGNLKLHHTPNLKYTVQHALSEGWVMFMGALFGGTTNPPYRVSGLIDKDGKKAGELGPPPLDGRGELVEGAFANGLWRLFCNHIAPSTAADTPLIRPSENGNVLASTSWLTDPGIPAKFQALIWRPLKALKSSSDPTSTLLLAEIRAQNSGKWASILPDLQRFNLAP